MSTCAFLIQGVALAKRGLVSALALPLLMFVAPAVTEGQTSTMTFTTCIDGEDFLIIQGSTLQWQYGSYTPVGVYRDDCTVTETSISTTLDGVPVQTTQWQPIWPTDYLPSGTVSSTFTGLTPALPATNMTVTITSTEARESISILQLPTAANNQTLILDFNDNDLGGADIYTVQLTITTAATWTVDSLMDDGSPGTLRYAIANANSGDTITFNVSGTINLTQGPLEIKKDLVVSGPGADALTISGSHTYTVFQIDSGATVTISGLTVQDGLGGVNGGDISNSGTLTITSSTLLMTTPSNGQGGGIFNTGILTVNDSSFLGSLYFGNASDGGGMFNNGIATVANSTFSSLGVGGYGGAIYNRSTLKVINTTFWRNGANAGGAIFNNGEATIVNSTLADNNAPGTGGAGIYNLNATLRVKNTILANTPSGGGNCYQNSPIPVVSYGHNLSDDNSCSALFTEVSDLNNMPAGFDPAGLKDNGGATETIALLETSPAVDAVPAASCTDVAGNAVTTDQRLITRPQGTACDIGAFEVERCVQPPSGLVSWWTGDGTFGDAQGINGGTNAGDVSFEPGKVGQAFHLTQSTNSYITLPNSPDLLPASNQLTIEAWVKPDWIAHNLVDQILNKLDQCGGNRSYTLAIDKEYVNGPYQPGVFVFSASVGGDDAISTTNFPRDGKYHHLAGTYDGASMNLYLDGALVGQKAHTGPIPFTSHPPYIGLQDVCGDRSSADFDEVSFYNRALSQAEIRAIVNAGSAGKCKPPERVSTTTTVKSSVNPSAVRQSVTFTASVAPGAGTGTPTGAVTFNDGATALGTGALNGSGQATFSTAGLVVGPHTITAAYSGDTNFAASTSAGLTQAVNRADTSIALGSSVNPSTYGQSVVFTAKVTSTAGTPTGPVTFKDGATVLGMSALDASGQAALGVTALSSGTHTVAANYEGDANFATSTSGAVGQMVSKAGTTTALNSSPNPSTSGQTVIFSATVVGQYGGPATGTVTFKEGTKTLGTGSLVGGTATLPLSTLGQGSHTVNASYAGDANLNGSMSAAITQNVVAKAYATLILSSSLNPSFVGQEVTFTATVNPSTATGTVNFKAGQTLLGTATISSGTARFATSSLSAGSLTIVAIYGGDTQFASGTTATIVQTVNKAATTTVLGSAPNPSSIGQSVAFTARVTSSTGVRPVGTVSFNEGNTALGTGTLDATGTATFSTAALTKGKHNIKAVYGATSAFSGSTSAVITQVVQ